MAGMNIISILRGRHNSLRHRFVTVPKEYLSYLAFRLKGKTWIDFYSHYLESKREEILPEDNMYLDVGEEFLELLKEQGLRPEHSLLDYGCGILRAGLHIIPYLEPWHYVGVDIAEARLQQGRELLSRNGISEDRYETVCVQDCTLDVLQGRRFDFVWAHAVMTHMPEKDIRELLESLPAILSDNAKFIFTFFAAERIGKNKLFVDQVRDFYYPEDYLKEVFAEKGFSFDLLPRNYRENWGLRVVSHYRPNA